MSKRNDDSKDYRDWTDSALNDFLSASNLLVSELYDQVCSLSYQSVEKSMKAFLTYAQGYSPETHNLEFLLKLCKKYNRNFSEFDYIPNMFKHYYVDVRYPSNNSPYVDDEVALDLVTHAGQMFNFTEDIILDMEDARVEANRNKYGKLKGYYLWDIAVDWYRLEGSKKFHEMYKFYWHPSNNKLIEEAKDYLWYTHRLHRY